MDQNQERLRVLFIDSTHPLLFEMLCRQAWIVTTGLRYLLQMLKKQFISMMA
jgi:hypothetical protein